ncbi:hypothetical protein [Bradyrhizobium ottawaense]|uniref:Uncharacterized protein n=1 Tax=Bradyrhizobium ottawaense TaxID=931866 RepID=A0ABY0QHG3_9BRAD|nr:hypothetical protein [Bradyrhizobium ottawaense]SDK45588.1 hypothetical protein SAMN05444163_8154 [Bradyrhizobium ottawaense]
MDGTSQGQGGQLTPAEAYVELALWGIKISQSAGQLRRWWDDERAHREQYGLSQEQTHQLVYSCREHLEQLGEYERERQEDEPAPRSRSKPKQRRGAAI